MHLKRLKYFLSAALVFICILIASAQASIYSYVATDDGVIYKVNLSNCTVDSIADLSGTSVGFSIYDIALSPSGKLYVLDANANIYLFNLNTLSLTLLATLSSGATVNALACDSMGNLVTIDNFPTNSQQPCLLSIDTLTGTPALICPVSSYTEGDIIFYEGDIYYDDVNDTLHRVTLNPPHDYVLGLVGCNASGSWGLSTNVTDTTKCQLSIFAYSIDNICQVSPITGNSTPYCQNIIPNLVGSITGAASVPGQGSCCVGKSSYVMPNAFTPNGDGLNDTYYPKLVNGATVQQFHIYDRWGALVHNSTQPWDGTFNAKPQPVGTYIYYVIINSESENCSSKTEKQEGAVTLLR